ncbi:unnamed protein product [Adineta steineri]|uniref:Uncharacterized protein n=1 Tax=Adineta steineri TaxID=433720 RepID=A0A813MFL8_9BILA|nr:unnamed protein product [Adineta steineri]CAF3479425.1 unnamed protein product [Adineta steineri]
MSRVSNDKLMTSVEAGLRMDTKLKRIISNRTIISAISFLSKTYDILPCFCENNSIEMIKYRQELTLSKSSNAFWRRNNKFIDKKKQRNNSTAFDTEQISSPHSDNIQKSFRRSFIQRFKQKVPTITARSVIHKHEDNIDDHLPFDLSNTFQTSFNRPSSTEHNSEHSSYDFNHLTSDENDTLKPTISSFKSEQQNINATNNTSQIIINNIESSKKIKSTSKRKKSNRQKNNSKRKTSLSKKKTISTSRLKKLTYAHSPFPNPDYFHSLPQLQNSDEITQNNVHENHLCCKPITSVKGLSTSDQKKLIEHDYLTLISLLPIYLGSQGNFSYKIHEKTNISSDGALILDHLMNEWSSARLFISATSHNKILTQSI